MKLRRLTALLLVFLLAASACSETTTASEGENTAAEPAAEVAAEETAPEEDADTRNSIPDDLPERDLDGYKFRMLTRDRSDFVKDIGLELEQTGEVVDDAIISRNLTVSERFNVEFAANYFVNGQAMPLNSVMSGDDEFDLMLGQIIEVTKNATKGYYLDWYEQLPYVNLEKPWYIGNAAEALSVNNHAYIMIGEFDLDVLRFTYGMFYNKDMSNEYSLENIYDVVQEGRWTYDYLHGLSEMIYMDINGDGVKDEGDILAISGDPYSAVVTYQYAFNNPLVGLDADGLPSLIFNREKAYDIVTRLNALYHETQGGYTSGWGTGSTAWSSGNLLVYTGLFQSAMSYRELEFDFGIIPYPKFDDAQDRYYTMSDGAHGGMMVPVTVPNAENVSIIVEALNAETYKQVVPAYYETSLKTKAARDEESSAMFDLLMESRVFDFGYMYNDALGGLAFTIQEMVSQNSTNTESAYAAKIKGAEKKFAKVVEDYLALDTANP